LLARLRVDESSVRELLALWACCLLDVWWWGFFRMYSLTQAGDEASKGPVMMFCVGDSMGHKSQS
jgi:hypothetical protein